MRIIVRLKMINYTEIFEEERIISKKVKNVISDKNDKESCIQKATVIMFFRSIRFGQQVLTKYQICD